MKLLDSLRFRIGAIFGRAHLNDEMDYELRSHVELRADDLERCGLTRAEAERRARIEFGGYQRFREECHEAAGGTFFEALRQDLRLAFRMLRKSPGFTTVAVATLALAIGANAVVFGILNALLIRPLNVADAQSLWGLERGPEKAVNQSYPDYLDLRDRNRSFEDLAAYNVTSVGLDTGNNPTASWILETTGNYFDDLGVQPYLGRFYHPSDEQGPNSAPYIVLTYAYWHSRFQDDPGVVGRIVQLNKHPFTILGVGPHDFQGTLIFIYPDFWVPLVNQEQVEGVYELNERAKRGLLMTLGHLKPGVTPAQAVADLNSIGAYLEKTYPKDDGKMTFALARPGLAGDWLGGPVRGFLSGLMALAGLILLAACANLGSLFAARAADRSREVALRLALGSKRSRILRTLLTEALLISLIGGTVGLMGSALLLRALSAWQPLPTAPLNVPVHPDANVYLFAVFLAVLSGLLFGVVPVRQVLRVSPYEVIKSGPLARTGRRISLRDILLVVQIAICAVLVTSSMVAIRGLVRSLNSNFGFGPNNALLVETAFNMAGYRNEDVPIMQRRMIDALQAVPGVQAVGSVDRPPLYYGANFTNVYTDKTSDLRPSNAAAHVATYNVSPDYFRAAVTPLLSGRDFSWHDDRDAPRVAVINQEFARKIFGSMAGALGGYYKLRDGTRVQVVGIAQDGKYESLAEDLQPAMFLSGLQWPATSMSLVVRAARDPQQLVGSVKDTVKGLDPGLPLNIVKWRQELESALFPSRMATISLGVLGVIGAMLSITGIFGMAAYSVSKRIKELGIRIALGAQHREVLQAALERAVRLLAFGSAAGLILGLLATRLLSSIVYQATPRDPLVLAGVVVAMAMIGVLATWIPAQRVLRLDPLVLLREE